MADTDVSSKEKNNEAEATKSEGKSLTLPLAIGGLIFVVCVVVFSFQLGVFSSSNVTHTIVPSHGTTEADHPAEEEADDYALSSYEELFSVGDNLDYLESGEEGMSEEDSLQKIAWYVQQKQEIEKEWTKLRYEKEKVEHLKDEAQTLLDRRAAIEDASIVQMAKLYENMKTEELIPILTNLPNDEVSLIISKMKKQKASDVLGKMQPNRAAKITRWLISLNDN